MNKKQKLTQVISLLLFAFGIALALAISALIIWGDFEAALFDPNIAADSTLRSFRCPVAITTHEVGTVSATIKNTTERDRDYFARAHISDGYVLLRREINQQVPIPAGEKETISWEVFPEEAVYQRLILFRIYVNAVYPDPSQGNSCGVLVIGFPGLTGAQLFWGLAILSLIAIFGGHYIWRKNTPNLHIENAKNPNAAMTGLSIVAFLTLLVGYLGVWMLGTLLVAVTVLMIGVILGRYIFAV